MKVRRVKHKNNRNDEIFSHDAYFHRWYYNPDSSMLGGILEKKDGTVTWIRYECIKFVDKPEIKNKTVADRLDAIE